MNSRRLIAAIGAAVLTAGGLTGVAFATAGNSTPVAPVVSGPGGLTYNYYQSMMRGFDSGSMMGGSSSYGSMMGGTAGYRWMMGGTTTAPEWMRGAILPGYMTRASSNAGKVMGALFANAPGPRISPAAANHLGNAHPAGATVNSGQTV